MRRRPVTDPHQELADAAREEMAAFARAAERTLRTTAADATTFRSIMRDLAERATPVVLRSVTGRLHAGLLTGVGADHLAVELRAGGTLMIALRAVRDVRPGGSGRSAPSFDDRDEPTGPTLVEMLDRLAQDDASLLLGLAGAGDLLGVEVLAVGEDVLTVRTTSGPRTVAHLPATAVIEVIREVPA